ncbi:MAG: ATP-grasp domain-containing protein [Planctomycetota bacterium]
MPHRILHLVGSAENDFLAGVSRAYATDCIEANNAAGLTDQHIAHVAPDGVWTFPTSLEDAAIAGADPVSEESALIEIDRLGIEVVLPHMFCREGMTRYRRLILDADLPLVGNVPEVTAIAADKWSTRQAVSRHGIRVPAAKLVDASRACLIELPVVVKPATADNSSGVSLVRTSSEFPAAIAEAAKHSSNVFAEEYIPAGREVRCGVIETGDGLQALPLQEYAIDERDHPIRNLQDKLVTTRSGRVDLASKHGSKPWIVESDDPVTAAVQEAAIACYTALNCRHYGLFDFRIDPDGTPWLLEAGLYCSFAPKSVLVMMADATGTTREAFLESMIERAWRSKLCTALN